MPQAVTNNDIDTLAAAVPSPYGPLTRVGDWSLMPTPNSEIRGQFTSALSVTVYLSWLELQSAEKTLEILEGAHEFTAVVADMKTAIGEWNTMAAAMSTPHTYDDYQALIDFAKTRFPWISGTIS